jgi:chemotaxis protein methyltransferase CheR
MCICYRERRPLSHEVCQVVSARTIKPEDYERFRRFLETSCGIVLGDNKQYLVLSRLSGLMVRHDAEDLGALVTRLERGGAQRLRAEVIDAMTTNETQWFRDVYPFALLKETLLPKFERAKRSSIRIWSAGCSSGQEPYSLSMAVDEYREAGRSLDAQIVGTDISPQMIARAQAAEYGATEVRRGLSPERQRRFFVSAGSERWRVRPETSRRVTFRQHNLLESFTVLGSFDLIFCRNVLIYFSLASREQIVRRMAQSLNPGGYLVVGASESLSRNLDDFEMERCDPGVIYRRRESPPRSRAAENLLSPRRP